MGLNCYRSSLITQTHTSQEVLLHLVILISVSDGQLTRAILLFWIIYIRAASLLTPPASCKSFPYKRKSFPFTALGAFMLWPTTILILSYLFVSVPWQSYFQKQQKKPKPQTRCILIAFLQFRKNTFTNSLQILPLFNESGKEHYKGNTPRVTLHRYVIILPINHIIIWIIQHRKSRIVFQLWFWKIQIRVDFAH